MKRSKRIPHALNKSYHSDLKDLQGSKPWLDPSGKRIPTALLKLLARTWDQDTWTAYLESFEEPAAEKYVSAKMWSDITEKLTVNVFELAQCSSSEEISGEVSSSIRVLPSFLRQVIRMTYWHNMSVRKIASELGLSKSVVHRMVKDAETTLRALIKSPAGQFALNESTNNFTKESDNDQDISA